MSRRARWLAAWGVATLLLALCFRAVGWASVVPVLARVRPAWVAAAVALNAAILLVRTRQWALLVPPGRTVPFLRMLRITAVSSMVANSVPFLAGQAAGLHLLATRGRVGHAAATSVTALEQVAEGVAKVAVLLLLAALGPLPGGLRGALLGLSAGVALLAAAVALLAGGGSAPAWLGRGRLEPVGRFVAEVRAALAATRRPRLLGAAVTLALGMKAFELLAILAASAAVGAGVGPRGALLALAAVSLATMVSVAPANLGVYEGSAFLAYRWLGVDPRTALGLAVVQHLAYLLPMAGGGWLAVLLWRGGTEAAAEGGAD